MYPQRSAPGKQSWRSMGSQRLDEPYIGISVLKKSVATKTSMCMRINSLQVVVLLRAGAGGIPCRLRMLPTV